LFYPLPIITLFLVIRELVQQGAGKFSALAAMTVFFVLATKFYGAGIAPKGFCNGNAAFAVHFFAILTGAAQQATT
jgi:hypothetical protein